MERKPGSSFAYKCPSGHKIFTRTPDRWCPYCEKDYIPAAESPEDLLERDFTEDCEENQWLFFDLPLRRSVTEGLAAAGFPVPDGLVTADKGKSVYTPGRNRADQDTITIEPIRE